MVHFVSICYSQISQVLTKIISPNFLLLPFHSFLLFTLLFYSIYLHCFADPYKVKKRHLIIYTFSQMSLLVNNYSY